MFYNAKTTRGRLHLAKELLKLPVEILKSFAGTREGLRMLNSWILDSMVKDGTQLLRHCVRLLVLVSTDLLAVRLSGIGKTIKEKVCVHTSRDIRVVASQLVSMWIEVFCKEKATKGGQKLLRQTTISESPKNKSFRASTSGKHTRNTHGAAYSRMQVPSPGKTSPSNTNNKKTNIKLVRLDTATDSKSEGNSLHSQEVVQDLYSQADDSNVPISEEEAAVFAAAEAARAAALVAAEIWKAGQVNMHLSKAGAYIQVSAMSHSLWTAALDQTLNDILLEEVEVREKGSDNRLLPETYVVAFEKMSNMTEMNVRPSYVKNRLKHQYRRYVQIRKLINIRGLGVTWDGVNKCIHIEDYEA